MRTWDPVPFVTSFIGDSQCIYGIGLDQSTGLGRTSQRKEGDLEVVEAISI